MSAVYKKRFEVVFLVTHPKGPKMSVAQAAKYAKTSLPFVKKWIKRYKETGSVDDLPSRGKTKATTRTTDKLIVKIFEEKPAITLRQARQKLLKKGIEVSIHTIRRRLMAVNIKHRSTMKKPLLTKKQVKKDLSGLRKIWSVIGSMSYLLMRVHSG